MLRVFALPCRYTYTLSWPTHESINQLASQANELFIWAQTVCKLISDSIDPERELEQLLAHGSLVVQGGSLVCTLYTIVLEKTHPANLTNNVNDGNTMGRETSPIQNVLATIVLTSSRRPLSINTLSALMGVSSQPLLNMVQSLGSVLYTDNNQAV